MNANLIPEICSGTALRQAARHLSKMYDEALASSGLSVNQYAMLSKLNRESGLMIQELAARMVMDRTTLSHLIRPLEQKGLVAISPSSEDGRRKVVALTSTGRATFKIAERLWRRAEDRFQKSFGKANAEEMRAMLHRICSTEL